MRRLITYALLIGVGFIVPGLITVFLEMTTRDKIFKSIEQVAREHDLSIDDLTWLETANCRVENSYVSLVSSDGQKGMFIMTIGSQQSNLLYRLDNMDGVVTYGIAEETDHYGISVVDMKLRTVTVAMQDGETRFLFYDTADGRIAVDRDMDGTIDHFLGKKEGINSTAFGITVSPKVDL